MKILVNLMEVITLHVYVYASSDVHGDIYMVQIGMQILYDFRGKWIVESHQNMITIANLPFMGLRISWVAVIPIFGP